MSTELSMQNNVFGWVRQQILQLNHWSHRHLCNLTHNAGMSPLAMDHLFHVQHQPGVTEPLVSLCVHAASHSKTCRHIIQIKSPYAYMLRRLSTSRMKSLVMQPLGSSTMMEDWVCLATSTLPCKTFSRQVMLPSGSTSTSSNSSGHKQLLAIQKAQQQLLQLTHILQA